MRKETLAKRKLALQSKPTSLRDNDYHLSKTDDEKRFYYSLLNDDSFGYTDDEEEIENSLEKKEFKEEKITENGLSTDSNAPAQNDVDDITENAIKRIKNYWHRNFPELFVKDILVRTVGSAIGALVGAVLVGTASYFYGVYQGNNTNQKIDMLKKEIYNQQASVAEIAFNNLLRDENSNLNKAINTKIDGKINIDKIIQKINEVNTTTPPVMSQK